MQIHSQLAGRLVEYVATNGEVLLIRLEDGRELRVAWVDDQGKQVKGKPVLAFVGTNIITRAARAQEIPHRLEVGL